MNRSMCSSAGNGIQPTASVAVQHHHAVAAESHHAATLRHERVDVVDEIHTDPYRLAGLRRDVPQQREQLGRVRLLDLRAGRDESEELGARA